MSIEVVTGRGFPVRLRDVTTIAALREPPPETRVALVPDIVGQLVRQGLTVIIQSGAGQAACADDAAYEAAGATVSADIDLETVDILAHVRPLSVELIGRLRPGAVTIGLDAPLDDEARLDALTSHRVTALSFELLPRISRAQSMDVLSSQALSSGYRCVLEAAIRLPRFFPLAMTAAGTVPPAKVLVLGVGVAGLQAIATARRLGAQVQANDIRASSAEEVRSVGATFIDLSVDGGEGTGGYARQLTTDAASAQQQALAPYVADSDVVITTAAVPGRPAPRLITAGMVAAMRPGSIVVDLAAPSGGNVEGSVAGEDVQVASTAANGSVTIVGLANPPGDLPVDSSRLFAKNVQNLAELILTEDGISVDFSDEIVDGCCLTHDGSRRRGEAPPLPTPGGTPSEAASSETEDAQ